MRFFFYFLLQLGEFFLRMNVILALTEIHFSMFSLEVDYLGLPLKCGTDQQQIIKDILPYKVTAQKRIFSM